MYDSLGLIVGIIGTAIAIYQAAIINESKKRKNELQYLFAGINAAAVQKQQAWQNQIALLPKPTTPEEWAVARVCISARDDVAELASLTSALEGTIDPDNSAIVAMMDKYKKIVDKNELMNPVLNRPQIVLTNQCIRPLKRRLIEAFCLIGSPTQDLLKST